MAQVSTYLNFARSTEAAFAFYKNVFKTEYVGGIARFRDMPAAPGQPSIPEEDKDLVLHVGMPILGGHLLMGSDAPESLGYRINPGNNVYINLQPDTRAEADRLFAELSEGGKVDMTMQEMFWGDYFGSFQDKFGIHWMIACSSKV